MSALLLVVCGLALGRAVAAIIIHEDKKKRGLL
ncbi:hypothetical protein SEA_RIKSENGUPTA_69 [Microbacterium phage RikSengupta]|nr:hypothetical protein SEA_TINYMINY_69 [Microbacterium phage TinyMiny]WMI33165.1 hypothetical protein SEA_RIKSENGUPTA_69 [Microbacterium phage RikSengupta]